MGEPNPARLPLKVPPWPSSFPKVIAHVSLEVLQSACLAVEEQPDDAGQSAAYRDAKAGNAEAARRVVEEVVRPKLITTLKQQFS